MEDFSINEMLDMQRALQEQFEVPPLTPLALKWGYFKESLNTPHRLNWSRYEAAVTGMKCHAG